MKIKFIVKPYQACMDIKVEYTKEEIQQEYFYLNRDFIINQCYIDSIKYNIDNEVELFTVWEEYEVKKYLLPQSFQHIVIEYTAYLTGKTGSCPYVRETISPEFTFIRWETFCYPLFFNGNESKTLYDFLVANIDADITLEVPDEFIAVSNVDEIKSSYENGIRKYEFKSSCNDFAVAIAKYKIKMLSIGKFYLLSEINSSQVEETMTTAHNFMNEHYGMREISSNVNYVAIPNTFGSFANPKTIFVDEVTFESIESMAHIIHEFIHLGWNVPADDETQRIRFFDEAFTSYFEMRVMEHLLKENYRLKECIDGYKHQINNGFDGNVPIIDFGKHEYGDLSYTIGAVCLYKLSEFVGLDVFEEATKIFLQKYKDTPVNIKIFCDEYINLCSKPELEQFFNDWIYTVNGPKSLIASY